MAKTNKSTSKDTGKQVRINEQKGDGGKTKAWQPVVDRTTTPPKKGNKK